MEKAFEEKEQLELVRNKWHEIRNIKEPSEAVQLAAVKQFGPAIQFIKNPSEQVQIAAVQNYSFSIAHIKNPSEKIQLEAVRQNEGAIEYIKNPSEQIQLVAVKKNGYVIKYIENPSEQVQLEAVKQSDYVIKYIKNPSEQVQLYLIKSGFCFTASIKNPSEQVQLAAKKEEIMRKPKKEISNLAKIQQHFKTPAILNLEKRIKKDELFEFLYVPKDLDSVSSIVFFSLEDLIKAFHSYNGKSKKHSEIAQIIIAIAVFEKEIIDGSFVLLNDDTLKSNNKIVNKYIKAIYSKFYKYKKLDSKVQKTINMLSKMVFNQSTLESEEIIKYCFNHSVTKKLQNLSSNQLKDVIEYFNDISFDSDECFTDDDFATSDVNSDNCVSIWISLAALCNKSKKAAEEIINKTSIDKELAQEFIDYAVNEKSNKAKQIKKGEKTEEELVLEEIKKHLDDIVAINKDISDLYDNARSDGSFNFSVLEKIHNIENKLEWFDIDDLKKAYDYYNKNLDFDYDIHFLLIADYLLYYGVNDDLSVILENKRKLYVRALNTEYYIKSFNNTTKTCIQVLNEHIAKIFKNFEWEDINNSSVGFVRKILSHAYVKTLSNLKPKELYDMLAYYDDTAFGYDSDLEKQKTIAFYFVIAGLCMKSSDCIEVLKTFVYEDVFGIDFDSFIEQVEDILKNKAEKQAEKTKLKGVVPEAIFVDDHLNHQEDNEEDEEIIQNDNEESSNHFSNLPLIAIFVLGLSTLFGMNLGIKAEKKKIRLPKAKSTIKEEVEEELSINSKEARI